MARMNLSGIEVPSGPAEPTTSARVWSPQQLAVFDAVEDLSRGSLRIDAVAGAGKTTCLVEASRRMKGQVAFGAFNKKIADEIKVRTSGFSGLTVGTMHSFGLRAWKQTAPNCEVDGDKVKTICEDLEVPFAIEAFTRFMVGIAKQNGWRGPVEYEDWNTAAEHFDARDKLPDNWAEDRDPFEYCNPVLQASVDRADSIIDFDDMIYMPLLYGHIDPAFNWVLVDEAQDTNRVRRMLVEALLAPKGRVVAVGDPHQAIYGFTGADADALDRIQQTFQCEYLPLTITYRCPKAIVAHARRWVSHIEAAPTAPEGILRSLDEDTFRQLTGDDLRAGDVILCRYTKPLVSQALYMIRKGIGARVEGREIGQSLLTLANRWKTANTLPKLTDRIEEYREKEARKFRAKGQAAKAGAVEDKCDSLIAVIHSLPSSGSIWDLKNRIQSLFGDSEPGKPPKVCTLSTIHKAKGREWDRVYLLGREQLQPSRFAKQDWELQQEDNLIYVAVTRAKQELVEVEYNG